MATFSNLQLLELQTCGITVAELVTRVMRSYFKKPERATKDSLPKASIYGPVKEAIEKALRQDRFADTIWRQKSGQSWLYRIVEEEPTPIIWRGNQAWSARIAAALPFGMFDGTVKQLRELDVVEQTIEKQD
jgi:1-acylglycerone phosphate reductase